MSMFLVTIDQLVELTVEHLDDIIEVGLRECDYGLPGVGHTVTIAKVEEDDR